MLTFFSPENFKNKDSIEEITSKWFGHQEAWRKRGEITRLIIQASKAAKSEERIPSMATDKLETERENKKEPIASSTSTSDMKVKELQEALAERGLSKSGRKADLVTRLESTLKTEGQPPTSSKVPLYLKFHSLNFNLDIFSNKMCLF